MITSEFSTRVAVYAALFVSFYLVIEGIRRTVLSPLWKVPGPFLAKLTRRWIWSKEISMQSCQTTRELHDKLGPIVQIAPNEVSIDDADVVHNVIYKQASHFYKNPEMYGHFQDMQGTPENLFLTTDPQSHSFLRRIMANSFSRKSVLGFEDEIWERSGEMSQRLSDVSKEGKAVDLAMMYRCLTMDVITKFAFGTSAGALKKPDFEEESLRAIDAMDYYLYMWWGLSGIRRVLAPVIERLPFLLFQAMNIFTKAVNRNLQNVNSNSETSMLFNSMKDAAKNMDKDLSEGELISTGFAALFAGTDTTGITLAVGSHGIFKNKEFQSRLQAELQKAWPDRSVRPSLMTLESIPYLRAVVKESLRLAMPAPGRLSRVVPIEGFNYKGYQIPPGTVISSSAYLMHTDKEIFPEPERFDPDRWLVEDADLLKARERHLFAFSEGSRKCIGINLAMAELYVTLALVFRNFRAVEVLTKEPKIDRIFNSSVIGGIKVVVERYEDEGKVVN